jgi:hypothetical protein
MKKWFYGLTCVVAFCMNVQAFAQDSGIASELERTASTSPAEKIAYAEVSNREVSDAVKHVGKLLETARRSDPDAVTCLQSRLTSIRALQQVSELAENNMASALNSESMERADHEFRKIAVAVSKTRQLSAEAERCVVTLTSGVEGTTKNEFTTSLTGDDADSWIEDIVNSFELGLGLDPPDVSPFG